MRNCLVCGKSLDGLPPPKKGERLYCSHACGHKVAARRYAERERARLLALKAEYPVAYCDVCGIRLDAEMARRRLEQGNKAKQNVRVCSDRCRHREWRRTIAAERLRKRKREEYAARQAALRINCDCGMSKAQEDKMCARCMSMDGETEQERRVISTLRILGGAATLAALEVETGGSIRNLQRGLSSLIDRSAVRRHHDEDFPQEEALFVLRGAC